MAPAQTFTSLDTFNGQNGENPYGPLIQATNGELYGASATGGNNSGGTVFKVSPGGTMALVYTFCPPCLTTGSTPYAGLIQATNGDFYGTAQSSGKNGYGAVFKLTPNGITGTALYSFCSLPMCADGEEPVGAVVQATDGNFYGTTSGGGLYGEGTVFQLSQAGTLATLYSFCALPDCIDGAQPSVALVQATDGDFYGTTQAGGANGGGTIFKVTSAGTLTTLYSFSCPETGCGGGSNNPAYGALIQATNGDFYGTAAAGGTNGQGTVFRMTPSGAVRTLYNFCSQTGCTDGSRPSGGLVQATDGNFYGTTEFGGANGEDFGTIFKITTAGTLTTLHSFGASNDGSGPVGAPVQDTNGSLYGTTSGLVTIGTVWRLSLGLHPFVRTQTPSGAPGATVKILGTNLTGASSVTFNGTPASINGVSATEITTTVPAGATSGTVKVVTPSGTLSSYPPFQVLE
jgi:uncharacterized repeat protein (TIGR03803 family)